MGEIAVRAPSAAQLLSVWEDAQRTAVPRRMLLLLRAACPSTDWETLESLSVGDRDGLLLTVRERCFGKSLTGLTQCPHCNESAETLFSTDDMRFHRDSGGTTLRGLWEGEGYAVRFRLPNSRDLEAMLESDTDTLESAKQQLFERCVIEASYFDKPVTVAELPEAIGRAVSEQMSAEDPQAETILNLTCPNCGTEYTARFDIAIYLWREIETWGRRLLNTVHLLATHYGWGEADILAMSAWRRQQYADRITGTNNG